MGECRWKATPLRLEEWKAWFDEQTALAGANLNKGLYISLRLDGRVRGSGQGPPPWQRLIAQLAPLEGALTGPRTCVDPQNVSVRVDVQVGAALASSTATNMHSKISRRTPVDDSLHVSTKQMLLGLLRVVRNIHGTRWNILDCHWLVARGDFLIDVSQGK